MPQTSFGPFVFDPVQPSLTHDGEPVAMNGRGAALLAALLDGRGAVVGRDALITAAWPGLIVDEANLTVQVGALRRLLGRRPNGRQWIETVSRVGYRLPQSSLESLPSVLPTVAVLQFANLSDDREHDYFGEGVVEDLLTALSRFKSFAVIGHPLVLQGETPADTRQMAREQGVHYLLDGSVRRAGVRLRITARLLDGAGKALWSGTFNGSVDDLFEFQDSITESVAAIVEPAIQQAEIEQARRERPGSITAYDLYLRGMKAAHSVWPASNAEAYGLLVRALALEPDNVRFLAGASSVLQHRVSSGWPAIGLDDREECRQLARRGLALADNDASAMATFGVSLINAKEPDVGLAAVRHALDLNPNSVSVLISGGVAHSHVGGLMDAEACFRRALLLGPHKRNQSFAMAGIARIHIIGGRNEEAREWATRSLSVDEGHSLTFWVLIAANALLGRLDEARHHLRRYLALAPGVKLSAIMAQRPNLDPARFAPILEGLTIAGMK